MHLGSQFGRKTYRQRCRPLARCPIAHRGFTGATKPGNIDRGIVRRSFAGRQITPGFHRRFGLLDVFQECGLAVKAAPAAGLEQFGEVLQSLLGKIAPARKDIAAASHVESLCHEAARKEKNGRRRNRTESTERDRDILWKTFPMSSERARPDPSPDKTPGRYGGLSQGVPARKSVERIPLKRERPARGDNRTGQAYMGAGVDGRSRRIQPWGGVTNPTLISRGRVAERSKPKGLF